MNNIEKDKKISEEVDKFLEDNALISNLVNKQMWHHVKKKKIRPVSILKWAAILIIVVGITSLFVVQLSSGKPEVLFSTYYKAFESSTEVRGINESHNIEYTFGQAMKAYNDEKYKEAVQMFDRVIEKDTNNNLAVFLSAICFIELNKLEDAIMRFEKLLRKNESSFVESTNWYLGLCYLKLKNKDAARLYFQKLVEYQNVYTERSNKILKKISK